MALIMANGNFHKTPFDQTMEDLQKTSIAFHATGSRLFHPQVDDHKNTYKDWDFFAQDATNIHQYLTDLGFKKISNKEADYTNDLNSVCVYRWEDKEGRQIDIQLQKSMEKKVRAQTMLMESLTALHSLGLDKVERRRLEKPLWRMALNAA